MSDKKLFRLVAVAIGTLVLAFGIVTAVVMTANHDRKVATTITSVQQPTAMQVASDFGCKDFKYEGAYFTGTCWRGYRQFVILTFPDKASRDALMAQTDYLHYHYVRITPTSIIYYYEGPR